MRTTMRTTIFLSSLVIVALVQNNGQVTADITMTRGGGGGGVGACMNDNTTSEQQKYFFHQELFDGQLISTLPINMMTCTGASCYNCNGSTTSSCPGGRDMGTCLQGLPAPPCNQTVINPSPVLPAACVNCTDEWANCIQDKCFGCFSTCKINPPGQCWTSTCECCAQAQCNPAFYTCAGFNASDFISSRDCPTQSPITGPPTATPPPRIQLFSGIVDLNGNAMQRNGVVAGSITGVLCGFTVLVIVVATFFD